jgi:hypothetical protein
LEFGYTCGVKYILLILFSYTINLNAQFTVHDAIKDVTDVIVQDVFSAPAAGRIYAYATIAAYEAMRPGFKDYNSLSAVLNEMPQMPLPEKNNTIDFEVAGTLACYLTAQNFIYSEYIISNKIDLLIENCSHTKKNIDITATINFATAIKDSIIKWSQNDNYLATRTLPKYTLINEPYAWQPTGPDYDDAIEPYWGELRTFIIDKQVINTFDEAPNYSSDSSSLFYIQAKEVYNTVNNLTSEQKIIADYWDDNPFTINYVGHLQFAKKKVSPAGHWMSIASTVMQGRQTPTIEATYIYALSAVTIADAFIACWRVKYHYNIMRPETYINKFISPGWQPYIATPAFPDFSSGHSTISAACATILTHFVGDNLFFTDAAINGQDEARRDFNSFHAAAKEASISRLYAGIHFRSAIEAGEKQGNEIGRMVINTVTQ